MQYAIITAGGVGKRMGENMPKQFLKINNKPLLMHTIQRFYDYSNELKIIITLPEKYISLWREMCNEYDFKVKHTIICGGNTRFASIKNGLDSINTNENDIIAVHDGARPFASITLIKNCFNTAIKYKSAIPVIKLTDTLRENEGKTLDRNEFRLAQTPQIFNANLLKKAYNQTYSNSFTDDSSVVESLGLITKTIDGEMNNIKITTPLDMILAQEIIKNY